MSVNRLLANLAQSLDSSSVGSFLSGDSADRFQTLQWTDVSGRPTVADSATTTSIIDSAYVQSRVITYTVGIDSATTIALLDSDYIGSKVTNDVGFFIYNYDTTAGQTLLDSSNEASNNAISYTPRYIMLFKNGVLLDSGDYTATSGNTIVLGTGADSAELVTVVKWAPGSSSASSAATWYGDRGLHIGGLLSDNVTSLNVIQYFDITSTGNATDFGDLSAAEYTSDACSNATYALNGGGYTTTLINTIDYVTVATTGNASDFGDLTQARSGISASSNGTYGLWQGGNTSGGQTTIDYVTIASPGNATDFGDLTVGRYYGTSFANTTYALMAGGRISGFANIQNTIDYVTVSTTGNATDFGDLGTVMEAAASASDSTYGVIAGGRDGQLPGDYQNIIQYVTIATTGNATDFGDLTVARAELGGCGNATRGVFSGGYGNTNGIFNTIDYITIASPGNATDLGDLLQNNRLGCATAGSP